MDCVNPALAGLERAPRIALAHLPTPLERLERLEQRLGVDRHPAIWIKRDDCTGLGLGGNKVRKLEYRRRAAARSK